MTNPITKHDRAALQNMTDEFNVKYVKAVTTSDAHAYYEAALLGRQIVHRLSLMNVVSDAVYDAEYEKAREKEQL